jgi:hypothetical protein
MTIISRLPGTSASLSETLRKKGRLKANASKVNASARSKSRNQLSKRLRRVNLGGVGRKNIKELNSICPFGCRRII